MARKNGPCVSQGLYVLTFRGPLASHDSNPYPNRGRIARYNATKLLTADFSHFGIGHFAWWTFRPRKNIFSPPPPSKFPNSPQTPSRPSTPPPPWAPPSGIFNKKWTRPPPGASDSPFPLPEQKKKIRNVHQVCQLPRRAFVCLLNPEGPTIKKIWSRSKFSISIEIFNLDRNFWSRSKILISMSRFPHKN